MISRNPASPFGIVSCAMASGVSSCWSIDALEKTHQLVLGCVELHQPLCACQRWGQGLHSVLVHHQDLQNPKANGDEVTLRSPKVDDDSAETLRLMVRDSIGGRVVSRFLDKTRTSNVLSSKKSSGLLIEKQTYLQVSFTRDRMVHGCKQQEMGSRFSSKMSAESLQTSGTDNAARSLLLATKTRSLRKCNLEGKC